MLVSFVKSENNFNNSSTLNGIKKEIRGDDIRLIRKLNLPQDYEIRCSIISADIL